MPFARICRKIVPASILFILMSLPAAAQGDTAGQPRSEWIEATKALYAELLPGSAQDVLLVPFQVRGNAVDQPARALMTRYLDDRLRRTTDLRIPPVTAISRALGESARTFDDREILRIADALKVKYIVRGYVGHDLDESMDVEIEIREREADAALAWQDNAFRKSWNRIPFSDEQPPEEAFRGMLDKIAASLPFPTMKNIGTFPVDNATPALPQSLAALASSKPADPLESAWRLQLLGLLAPGWTEAGEPFFERSLVALARLSPRLPGFALLKSRALFHLHRRPAAVAALGTPTTPEEKAFAAFLDADLPETAKRTNEIASPLPLLLARIELNDLRWDFDRHLPRQESYADLAGALPELRTLLMIRLQDRNYWVAPSNLLVKERLDKDFPLEGFTAKSLATGRLMLGDSPTEGEEIELSVHRHIRKVLGSRGKDLLAADDAASPVERDALDLYGAFGESNLARKVYLMARVQAIPEEALKALDLYDSVYRGHPALTFLRATALKGVMLERQQESHVPLLRDARARALEAFQWAGGQTKVSLLAMKLLNEDSDRTGELPAFFDHDYPMRWNWYVAGAEDRKTLRRSSLSPGNLSRLASLSPENIRNSELSLLYTQHGFYLFKHYYERITRSPANQAAADAFLLANERRFTGHPDRASFLAGLKIKARDENGAAAIYEASIRDIPEVWEPYRNLGDMMFRRGEIGKASELYGKYPLFGDGENDNRDTVALSNYAYEAGSRFWFLGETEKAIPLYRISAGYRTGSATGMLASARVALANNDFQQAARHYLESVKRYGTPPAVRDYLSLLYGLGAGKQAWPLFDSIIGKISDFPIWTAARIGHRIDGASDGEIALWSARPDIRNRLGADAGEKLLAFYVMDRELSREVGWKIQEAERGAHAAGFGVSRAVYASDLYNLHYLVRRDDWDGAVGFIKGPVQFFQSDAVLQEAALPYMAWAGVKAGTGNRFLPFIEARAVAEPFGYRLAKGLFNGANGQHEEAVRLLKEAFWRIPYSYDKDRPIDPWYQLVEACEWLYADSKRSEYREMAIEWARRHQRIRPLDGWAYAVEAKYSDNPASRLRALALALYLDRRSERISGISEEEKGKAREWLENNNPFRIRKTSQGGV